MTENENSTTIMLSDENKRQNLKKTKDKRNNKESNEI